MPRYVGVYFSSLQPPFFSGWMRRPRASSRKDLFLAVLWALGLLLGPGLAASRCSNSARVHWA